MLITKNQLHKFLLTLLLIYSTWLRLSHLNNSYHYSDNYRDYLVARNIVSQHQLIWVGPLNGTSGLFSSPVYDYLLAGFLLIHNSLLFLDLVNIFFQIGAIICIYLIGRLAFSKNVGLLAAGFYSFHKIALVQSQTVFQPYLMVPVLYLSLLLLLISVQKKNFRLLLLSILTGCLAMVIHNSAMSLIPIFILGIILAKRKLALIFLVLCLGIFYLPPTLYLHSGFSTWLATPGVFWERLAHNLGIIMQLNSYLYSSQLRPFLDSGWLYNLVLLSNLTLLGFYLRWSKIPSRQKKLIVILISLIILPLILASIIGSHIHTRHFILILGPVCLIISEVLLKTLTKNFYSKIILVIVCLSVGLNFMDNPKDFLPQPINFSPPKDQISQALDQTQLSVLEIKKSQNYPDFNFFQFYLSPNTPSINGWTDAEYYLGLEDRLKAHLTTNDDSKLGMGYRPLGRDDYLFLICRQEILEQKMEGCLSDFSKANQGYKLIKTIFSTPGIGFYLFKNGLTKT